MELTKRQKANAYMREWTKKNPDRVASVQKNMMDKRREIVAEERRARGDACLDCGYECDLVWHHRDPAEKKFVVGNGGYPKGFDSIREEMAKCDLLCPNCHARRHRENPN